MKEFGWTIEYTLNLSFPIFCDLISLIRRVRADSAIDEFFTPYAAVKFGGKISKQLFSDRGSFYLETNEEKEYSPEEIENATKKLQAIITNRQKKLENIIKN